jgi:hypothetical protein
MANTPFDFLNTPTRFASLGLNFKTGRRDDPAQSYYTGIKSSEALPGFSTDKTDYQSLLSEFVPAGYQAPTFGAATGQQVNPTVNAVPDLSPAQMAAIQYQQIMGPYNRAERNEAAAFQSDLTQQQLERTYPFLSAAANEATQRALSASKEWAAYKQGLPTTAQDIMTAKQNQLTSAAQAKYLEDLGIASLNTSAKQQAKLGYTGKSFSS